MSNTLPKELQDIRDTVSDNLDHRAQQFYDRGFNACYTAIQQNPGLVKSLYELPISNSELGDLLCNVGQLINGFKPDAVEDNSWSEWDESVLQEVVNVLQKLHNHIGEHLALRIQQMDQPFPEAEEKAIQLYDKFRYAVQPEAITMADAKRLEPYFESSAKNSAIIAIHEILQTKSDCGCEQSIQMNRKTETYITYWLSVKAAILKICRWGAEQ